ncbi:uncharacterized protein LOC124448033 [Xenia sp. Carnegie-2017]|uniref:uncharacterized protein LOC124448033 n=1 Tax=Xenia sp. Carnegie-2017 TaxID=2897299 RepID=UPI001F03EA31|nr:uncharacterized protein LOC124448033 [Xenia sp. Carnegie-2017]
MAKIQVRNARDTSVLDGHRRSARKSANKLKEKIRETDGEIDRNELRQLRDGLNDKIATLKILNDAIIDMLSKSNEENAEEELGKEIEVTGEIRAEFKQAIMDVSDIVKESNVTVETATTALNGTLNSSLSSETRRVIRAKLLNVEVKKFSGGLQEWQEFLDSFDSADSLPEPARSTISGFPLTSENYHEAVGLLKRRYGKKNVIKKAHIQDLMNVKPVTDERDIDKFRQLYDTCETSYRNLKALGVDEAVYSSILIPEVNAK